MMTPSHSQLGSKRDVASVGAERLTTGLDTGKIGTQAWFPNRLARMSNLLILNLPKRGLGAKKIATHRVKWAIKALSLSWIKACPILSLQSWPKQWRKNVTTLLTSSRVCNYHLLVGPNLNTTIRNVTQILHLKRNSNPIQSVKRFSLWKQTQSKLLKILASSNAQMQSWLL